MSSKTAKNTQKLELTNIIENIVFVGLCILLFYPPYLRGLYFDRELLPTQVLIFSIFIIFMIYMIKSKENIKIGSLMDYGIIGLFVAYILPLVLGQAAYTRTAIGEALKYATYIAIYFMIKHLFNTDKKVKILINVLLISGLGVAIIGIGSAIGIFNYNGAFVWGRINSTLQYPNTLASYMIALTILTIGLFITSDKLWQKVLYQLVGFILFFTFIFTYSRGAYVLFPVIALILFVGLKKEDILNSIFFILNASLSTVIIMNKFSYFIQQKLILKSWGVLLFGIIASIILFFISNYIVSKLNRVNTKLLLTIGIIIILVVGIIGTNIIYTILTNDSIESLENKFITKIVPKFMLARLMEINLKDVETMQRTYYYKDAFKIIKDYPIIGAGGGGWAALYGMYQSFYYTSTQAHNYIIQTWIETGIIGLLFLITIVISLIISAFKYLKSKTKNSLLWSVFTSAIALFIHSIIDFDFALTSITLIFFSLLALIDSNIPNYIKGKKIKINNILVAILACIVLIFSSSLMLGSSYASKAVAAVKSKDIDKAQIYFEKATTFDPFKKEYKLDLASTYRNKYKISKNKMFITKEKELIESIVKSNPYNSYVLARAASFYMSIGQIEKGLDYIDQSVKVQPMRPENYQQKAQGYLQVAMYYIKNKKIDKAKECLKKIIEIENHINELNKTIIKPIKITDKTKEIINQAKMLLNKLGVKYQF